MRGEGGTANNPPFRGEQWSKCFICRYHPGSICCNFPWGLEVWILWLVGSTRGRSEYSQTCNMHPSFTSILSRQTGGSSRFQHRHAANPIPPLVHSLACSSLSLAKLLPRVCEPRGSQLAGLTPTNELKFEWTRSQLVLYHQPFIYSLVEILFLFLVLLLLLLWDRRPTHNII